MGGSVSFSLSNWERGFGESGAFFTGNREWGG